MCLNCQKFKNVTLDQVGGGSILNYINTYITHNKSICKYSNIIIAQIYSY